MSCGAVTRRSAAVVLIALLAGVLAAVRPPVAAAGGTPTCNPSVKAPGNDCFDSPQLLTGPSGEVAGDTTGASLDTGEPGTKEGSSVWFEWTAPAKGDVVFATRHSALDTVVNVYTGDTLTDLVGVAGDDNGGPGLTSRVFFTAGAGTAYRIQVFGTLQSAGPFQLQWGPFVPPVPPANDNFASATQLVGSTGTTTGTTEGATKEIGEPDHGAGVSVWFAWTAPDDQVIQFATAESEFDTLLGAYTGDKVDALSEVAFDDNALGSTSSLITFTATKGTTYHLLVDGSGGDYGEYQLAWQPVSVATNDDRANAEVLEGDEGTFVGSTVGASKEPGEPDHAGDPGGASVWFSWTPSSNFAAEVTTAGSDFNTLLAVYVDDPKAGLVEVASNDDEGTSGTSAVQFTAAAQTTYLIAVDGKGGASGSYSLHWGPPLPPANDDFAKPTFLSGVSGQIDGSNVHATREPGEPDHDGVPGGASVWFTWQAPISGTYVFTTEGASFDTVLAAVPGSSVTETTELDGNDDTIGTSSQITFDAAGGTGANIVVDGKNGATGTFTLRWQPAFAANDAFAAATPLAGASGAITTENVGATKEKGEPDHAGVAGGASIWFSWTAPADMTVTFHASVPADSYSTVVGVYTGDAVDQLSPVAAGGPSFGAARATFSAAKGAVYRIALDTVAGRMGALRLRWDPPPANDDVAAAAAISGAGGSVTASNGGATSEPGEPTHGNPGGASVWFAWTAPARGAATFQVSGATFSSEAAVYTGSDVAHLTKVVEASGPMTFSAAAGQRYLVAVDGAFGVVGTFTLEWSLLEPPTNDDFASPQAIAGPAGSVAGTTRGATAELGEPAHAGVTGASVWYQWTAPAGGLVTFTAGMPLAVYTGDSVDKLTPVASDEHTGVNGTLGEEVRFAAAAGGTYHVAIATAPDREIPFQLRWAPTPANDDLTSPTQIDGESGKVAATTAGATEQYGVEPGHANEVGPIAGNSVWFTFTPPVRGAYEVAAEAPSFFQGRSVEWYVSDGKGGLQKLPQTELQSGALATLFAGTRYYLAVDDVVDEAFDLQWDRIPAPANDDFENAAPISGPAGEVSTDTTGATHQPGEPDHAGVPGDASVWYRWTAPTDGRFTFLGGELLAVYTGPALTQLTTVAADDDPPYVGKNAPPGIDPDNKCMYGDLTVAEVRFDARSGQTYLIATDGSRGLADLSWAPTPANDDIADAALIQGATGSVGGTTTLATRQVGELTPSCPPGVLTVHYRWTAPASGIYRFRADMPSIFPVLPSVGIATGAGSFDKLGPANLVNEPGRSANNDVFLAATGGTAYEIQVAAPAYLHGDFTLSWKLIPANDDFAAATPIGGASGSVTGSNVNATVEAGEPRLSDVQDAHASVWYRWTAPHDGTFRFDASGSGFDASVMVFAGDRVDSLKERLNADTFTPAHTVAVTVSAGEVLAVRVDGLGATTGPVKLEWSEPQPQIQVGDAFPVSEADVAAGKGSAGFPLFLSFPTSRQVTVAYRTADGTASAAAGDYASASGQVVFKPFQTDGIINVAVNDDALNEADETFSVVLSDPVNATVLRGAGTGTILDNDPVPVLSVGSVSVTEGDSGTAPVAVPLTLAKPSGRAIRVTVSSANGTALAGADYVAVSTVVTIPAGTMSASVAVPIIGDTVIEPTESFSVTAAADYATVAPGGGVVTIVDEDAPAVLGATSAPPSAQAGAPVDVRVAFTDQDLPDRHTAVVAWGDGTTSAATVSESPGQGTASATHTYAAAGLFTPQVTVTDTGGGVVKGALPLVAIFDPAAGRVDASGRIGGDKGPAFSVSAGYTKKGAGPNGSVTLQTDSLDFSGNSLDWLVVAGGKAVVSGTGKVGKRDGYRFVVVVTGGQQPRVRFQLVDPTGAVVFDTQPGAPIDADPATPVAKAKVAIG